ncbi:cell growth-regulating nucleolar protein-like [Hetaerina americana]|uniref:cell growth-regulating nucleolar protein-like n=1 Tax=Hetaerina americana TaxID=62018 RepID=UPI003A7F1802
MVFFTCNHCGNALKKNKVEKHYAVECRKPPAVSCMDCLKDFFGQDYVSHNKCVSEEQKYSGRPLNGVTELGKGEKKQMAWVETVRQIIETKGSTLSSQERQLLENLKDFENIPRKKKKFENFLKNAMGRYVDPRTIEKVWTLLEGQKSASNGKEMTDAKEVQPSSTKQEEDPQPELEDVDQSSPTETSKLTKKERKEKKKKQKYELELESISKEKEELENDKNLAEEDMELIKEEAQGEGKDNKSKKSKKKKKGKLEEEANAKESTEPAVVNGTKGADKKKGKRKHSENVEDENCEKKRKKGVKEEHDSQDTEDGESTATGVNGVTTEDIRGKGKFKWNKTILSVLNTVPDNELPVKRLRKKVLSEYQEALGEGKCLEMSLEEAMGMFERKLHKIPGVKVHKDKVKLVKSS